MSKKESYIPYETIAMAEVQDDPTIEKFMRSIFPGASSDAVEKFQHFVKGKIHDGIQIGIELSTGTPMSEIQAFNLGVEEGYECAMEDRTITEGEE